MQKIKMKRVKDKGLMILKKDETLEQAIERYDKSNKKDKFWYQELRAYIKKNLLFESEHEANKFYYGLYAGISFDVKKEYTTCKLYKNMKDRLP